MKFDFRKKILLILSLSCFFAASVTAGSASSTNRRTALRCLASSVNYANENNFQAALSQVSLGLAYDDTISDLWYMMATCSASLGSTRAQILPSLEKAFQYEDWVNYNRDNARLLYAEILTETGRSKEALKVLDAKPSLYSADSEYIRVKAYYRLGNVDSIEKARNKIDGARRIYPSDTRFPLVFFKNEDPLAQNAAVKRIAAYFLSQISQYAEAAPDKDAELEIYASSFATGEDQKHLLQSFSARGLRHALYAKNALEAGLINQQQAFDYMTTFADESIEYKILVDLMKLLNEEEVLKNASEYFEAYSGKIYFDTDNDGNSNLCARYMRGRPQELIYDFNQDGVIDWNVMCDFGVPVSGHLEVKNMDFVWGTFPYLSEVDFKKTDKTTGQYFRLVEESLLWTPVFIQKEDLISEKCGKDFFIPVINTKVSLISNAELLDSASDFEINSTVLNGERIHFVLMDGNIKMSHYYNSKGRLYAQAQFEHNIPVLRVVDCDEDGVFETTEFYDIDMLGNMNVHSLQDERSVMKNLYGLPSENAEFYLRMVQVDTNNDTVPDFTEEYVENGGKISSWDTDGDGKWNVRHVVFGGQIKEESMFYTNPGNVLVTVTLENGFPVSVTNGNEVLKVEHSSSASNLYFIGNAEIDFGEPRFTGISRKVENVLNSMNTQAASTVIEFDDINVLCIRTGSFDFAMVTGKIDEKKSE